MKTRFTLSALALVAASGLALADNMPCSIHPPKGTSKSDLAAMAKITQTDAEKSALASVGAQSGAGAVKETELEVEDGCLIYEVKVKGSDAKVREIMVDAGDGKVLGDDDHHEN